MQLAPCLTLPFSFGADIVSGCRGVYVVGALLDTTFQLWCRYRVRLSRSVCSWRAS